MSGGDPRARARSRFLHQGGPRTRSRRGTNLLEGTNIFKERAALLAARLPPTLSGSGRDLAPPAHDPPPDYEDSEEGEDEDAYEDEEGAQVYGLSNEPAAVYGLDVGPPSRPPIFSVPPPSHPPPALGASSHTFSDRAALRCTATARMLIPECFADS